MQNETVQFFNMNSLLDPLRHLKFWLLLSKIFGFNFTWRCNFLNALQLIYSLVLRIFWYFSFLDNFKSNHSRTFFATVYKKLVCFTYIITLTNSLFESILQRTCSRGLLKDVFSFYKNTKLNFNKDKYYLNRNDIIIYTIILTGMVSICLTEYLGEIRPNLIYHIYFNNYPIYMNVINLLLVQNILYAIKILFIDVKEKLNDCFNKTRLYFENDLVKCLIRTHNRLANISENVNSIYGWQMVSSLLTAYLVIVSDIFKLVSYDERKTTNVPRLLSFSVTLILFCSTIYLLVEEAVAVEKEVSLSNFK